MPITVDWKDKTKTLIQCQFDDPWSVEQLIEARKSWHRMIKSVDATVPIVLDMQGSYAVPHGALRHLTAIHRTPHPRQGCVYVLGLNAEYQKISPFVFCCAACGEQHIRLVDSIESIN